MKKNIMRKITEKESYRLVYIRFEWHCFRVTSMSAEEAEQYSNVKFCEKKKNSSNYRYCR